MVYSMRKKLVFISSFLGYVGFAQMAVAQTNATCVLNGRTVPCDELGESLTGVMGLGLGIMAVFAIISIACLIFWIMMIVHASSHPVPNKAMWIVVMVFTGVLGAIIYYFVVKRTFGNIPTPPSATSMPPTPTSSV